MKNGKMSWWLVILTGALIVAAGIFLLATNNINAEDNVALDTLMFVIGLIVFLYGVYNLYKAYTLKNEHRMFVAHLVHGILDIILLLLILFLPDTPTLLGVILACWFIVFGLFGLVQNGPASDKNRQTRRVSILLLAVGLVLLIFPLALDINYILLLGITGIVIGVARVAQGIIIKLRYDERTSGGRSNLL